MNFNSDNEVIYFFDNRELKHEVFLTHRRKPEVSFFPY